MLCVGKGNLCLAESISSLLPALSLIQLRADCQETGISSSLTAHIANVTLLHLLT